MYMGGITSLFPVQKGLNHPESSLYLADDSVLNDLFQKISDMLVSLVRGWRRHSCSWSWGQWVWRDIPLI